MFTAESKHFFSVIFCLILVYLSWGSSFIAIKFGLESFPPFMLCGLRMLTAGLLLYGVTWLRGERTVLNRKDWKQDSILAFLMVLVSSGFLCVGQESVSSGTAALICGAVPILMVLSGWLFLGEGKPSRVQFFGLAGGFGGLVLLTLYQGGTGQDSLWGIFIVFVCACGWVAGSFYSKKHRSENRHSLMRTSAILMALGGAQSLLVAACFGELRRFDPAAVSVLSLVAFAYLVIMGGIVAYSSYLWLLMNTRTEVAISYEYVNPVIGVFLGWWLANEAVGPVIIAACVMTVGSVFFVVSKK